MGNQQEGSKSYRIIRGILLAAVLLAAGALGWRATQSGGEIQPAMFPPSYEVTQHARVEIDIQGMDCLMCAAGLQNHLRALPGVLKAEVSYQDKRALVEFNPMVVDRAQLEKAIEKAGLKVAGVISHN